MVSAQRYIMRFPNVKTAIKRGIQRKLQKSNCFSGPATKHPPPRELSEPIFFGISFSSFKKSSVFLVAKKDFFLRLPDGINKMVIIKSSALPTQFMAINLSYNRSRVSQKCCLLKHFYYVLL